MKKTRARRKIVVLERRIEKLRTDLANISDSYRACLRKLSEMQDDPRLAEHFADSNQIAAYQSATECLTLAENLLILAGHLLESAREEGVCGTLHISLQAVKTGFDEFEHGHLPSRRRFQNYR